MNLAKSCAGALQMLRRTRVHLHLCTCACTWTICSSCCWLFDTGIGNIAYIVKNCSSRRQCQQRFKAMRHLIHLSAVNIGERADACISLSLLLSLSLCVRVCIHISRISIQCISFVDVGSTRIGFKKFSVDFQLEQSEIYLYIYTRVHMYIPLSLFYWLSYIFKIPSSNSIIPSASFYALLIIVNQLFMHPHQYDSQNTLMAFTSSLIFINWIILQWVLKADNIGPTAGGKWSIC